ncbi:MAG: response regulator transcription factor [Cumulibacter sp.]
MPTSVLVVDDHQTFADLMRLGLDAQRDIQCVALAHSVTAACRIAATVEFSAAIVDLGLPDGDGAQLVTELHRMAPDARIIVLTAHPRSDLARRALAAGAYRVLPKHGRLDELLIALRERKPRPAPPPGDSVLSPREQEILRLLSQGMDVRGAASHLTLSVYTVRDHVKSILAKLGARTQLEAVVIAARTGMVLMEPQ